MRKKKRYAIIKTHYLYFLKRTETKITQKQIQNTDTDTDVLYNIMLHVAVARVVLVKIEITMLNVIL